MSYNSTENLEHVKSIAQRLEAVCAGDLYRDDAGDMWDTSDQDAYQNDDDARDMWEYDDARDMWERTNGETSDDDPRDMWDQVSVFDYFEDCFDIEYRVSSPHDTEPRSVRIMVACGEPNIYVDTASQSVELYWWGDRASYPLTSDATAEIDAAFAELWNC